MIIDTHAHCYWENIIFRIDDIIQNMNDKGVSHTIQIGCDIETSNKALSLARNFPKVFFATIGHHPETAQDVGFNESSVFADMKKLIEENREYIVAIGEAGLDYHYLSEDNDIALSQKISQERWFIAQWQLAQEFDLPLIIHTRDAKEDTIRIMLENNINKAVIHCYSEDYEFAETLMKFSDTIYFAFGGILTYKKSEAVQKTAKMLPLSKILLETDAPFLSPQMVRGTVNEPANIRYILEELCNLRDESPSEIEDVVYNNSVKFYSLNI